MFLFFILTFCDFEAAAQYENPSGLVIATKFDHMSPSRFLRADNEGGTVTTQKSIFLGGCPIIIISNGGHMWEEENDD